MSVRDRSALWNTRRQVFIHPPPCPCRKRRSHWSSSVLVLVDDASHPVASLDPESLEVGYLGW